MFVLVTHNQHKLQEIKSLWNWQTPLVSLSDIGWTQNIKERGLTFHENALFKAQTVASAKKVSCIADDSGLCVSALDNAPGVYSARYAGVPTNADRNIEKLLFQLCNKTNRSAYFTTVICLVHNNAIHYFEGNIHGEIIHIPKGKNGFGYDPIFMPTGYNKTFAELDPYEKNNISHRAIAIKKLLNYLETTLG